MIHDSYEDLIALLTELNTEKREIQKEIDDNNLQIIEARSYTKEILDKEDDDFKVFSPRKIEDIYKDELEKSNLKRLEFENRNQVLFVKIEKLESITTVLEKALAEIQSGNIDSREDPEVNQEPVPDVIESGNDLESENDEVSDTIKKSIQNLKRLSHKIEVIKKLVLHDPMRVCNELDSVNTTMNKIIDTLSHIL